MQDCGVPREGSGQLTVPPSACRQLVCRTECFWRLDGQHRALGLCSLHCWSQNSMVTAVFRVSEGPEWTFVLPAPGFADLLVRPPHCPRFGQVLPLSVAGAHQLAPSLLRTPHQSPWRALWGLSVNSCAAFSPLPRSSSAG